MKSLLVTFLFLLATFYSYSQPVISFTFDDGITADMPGYPFEQWNEMILKHLDEANVRAIFFVTGFNKLDEKGRHLLKSWNDRHHRIASHTYSHLNYSSKSISFDHFKLDFMRADSIIRRYGNFIPLFRFPYLKEGETPEKVQAFRSLLLERNYRNGSVTIDASDWYIDSRLRKALKENPSIDTDPYRRYYIEHLFDRATYYEDLAFKLTGRHISHTLLLHHNLTSALFLGELISMFKQRGWIVISAEEAFKDKIFESVPSSVPAGESLIWALAKESGKYEDILRYPAEDSRYEEAEMNRRGL